MEDLDVREVEGRLEITAFQRWEDCSFVAEIVERVKDGPTEIIICKKYTSGDFFCLRKLLRDPPDYKEMVFIPKEIVKIMSKNLNWKGNPNGADKIQESGEALPQD